MTASKVVPVTVDVGSNMHAMLEALARQIGVTADAIFPWYVQQARLEGVTNAFVLFTMLSVFVLICVILWRGKLIDEHNDITERGVAFAMSCIVTAITIFVGAEKSSTIITKIVNPQYHAIHMIARDIGLGGKK